SFYEQFNFAAIIARKPFHPRAGHQRFRRPHCGGRQDNYSRGQDRLWLRRRDRQWRTRNQDRPRRRWRGRRWSWRSSGGRLRSGTAGHSLYRGGGQEEALWDAAPGRGPRSALRTAQKKVEGANVILRAAAPSLCEWPAESRTPIVHLPLRVSSMRSAARI